jgi:hypothetical protein
MADPEAYWSTLASRGTHKNVVFTTEALAEYKGNFASHEAVHAVSPSCTVATWPSDRSISRFELTQADMRGLPRLRDH